MEYLNIEDTNDKLSLEIKGDINTGLDKSIINGIRRTAISSINTVSFDNITIVENNTSTHNEYIVQRIELIPLFIDPNKYNNDYLFMIDVTNDNDNTVLKITTNDFTIYPLKKTSIYKESVTIDDYDLDNKISDKLKNIIIKPFKIRDIVSYIFITELNSTNSSEHQSLKLYAIPNVGTGYKHARYNNVSNSVYTFHLDNNIFEKSLKNQIELKKIEKDNLEEFKKDYTFENIERFYHRDNNTEPYWYDFNIVSYHYNPPIILFKQSILIIKKMIQESIIEFEKLVSDDEKSKFSYQKKNKLFIIRMNNHDDTIGNIIQSHIAKTLDKNNFITVCGYRKPHPLEFYIELYISPREMYDNEKQTLNLLVQSLNNVLLKIIDILDQMYTSI
jgi:DNA-directed RNA polymerase subunit L